MRGRSSASLGPNTVKEAISFEDATTLVLKGGLQRVGILGTELEGGTSWLYCRIGGGCHLGEDPLDSNSNFQDPACYQVAIHGYGFPTLEGIIHQTIGGFVMTGSAGGSLKHSFADVIREIEFVNGNAEVQIPTPGSGLWCAVGVYMGVFQWYNYPSDIPFSTDAIYRRVRIQPPVCLLHAWTIHKVEERQSKLKKSLEEYLRVNWFLKRG